MSTTAAADIITSTVDVRYYVAGHNDAGYLPDSEPTWCADADQARAVLIGELSWSADHEEDSDYSDELSAIAEDVNVSGSTFGTVDSRGHSWWLDSVTDSVRVIFDRAGSLGDIAAAVECELPEGLDEEDRETIAQRTAERLDAAYRA